MVAIPIATLLNAGSDADGDSLILTGVDGSSTNGVLVTTNGAYVYYQNDANPPDRFGFTISDGAEGFATGLVQIVPGAVFSPVISADPLPLTNEVGTSATFYVSVSGTLPMTYQWQFNGTNLAVATDSGYSLPSVTAVDAGDYQAICSNIGGSATSKVATLTVLLPTPATIISWGMLPDRRFQLHVSAQPGHYAVDATTNLVNWEEIATLSMATNNFEFIDGDTSWTHRGYRVRTLAP